MTYTAAHRQGAMEILWHYIREALMPPIFRYSQDTHSEVPDHQVQQLASEEPDIFHRH